MAEHILQDTDIRKILRRNILDPKHQPQISDTVGKYLMIQPGAAGQVFFLIYQRRRLPLHILSLKQRDFGQVLRGIRILTERGQGFHHAVNAAYLRFGHCFLHGCKLVRQLLFLLCGKPLFRLQNHHGGMGVFQQVFFYQPLEIPLLHLFPKLSVGLVGLDMDERAIVVIYPASQRLQAVHKPLGIPAEIRLSVPELEMVDGGQQGLFVKAFLRDFRKGLPDGRLELLFPGEGSPLCHHAEIRLL